MAKDDIVVYTTTNCSRCLLVKRFLALQGIPFREVQVFRTPGAIDELIRRTGALAAPVVTVGDRFIRGYDPQALTALLEEHGLIRSDE